jgi:hypothetical protein
MASSSFRDRHRWDAIFYPLLLLPAWIALIMGFGPNLLKTLEGQVPAPPLFMHVHAAIFGGWICLLTVQTLLIGAGQTRIHKALGLISFVWIPLLTVCGVLTAIWVNQNHFDGGNLRRPPFIAIQFANMAVFAVAAGLAVAFRKWPDIHKRLIWLATIELLGAGFGRWIGRALRPYLGDSLPEYWFGLFLGTNLMLLACILYDLITRRKIHPVWLIGVPLRSARNG